MLPETNEMLQRVCAAVAASTGVEMLEAFKKTADASEMRHACSWLLTNDCGHAFFYASWALRQINWFDLNVEKGLLRSFAMDRRNRADLRASAALALRKSGEDVTEELAREFHPAAAKGNSESLLGLGELGTKTALRILCRLYNGRRDETDKFVHFVMLSIVIVVKTIRGEAAANRLTSDFERLNRSFAKRISEMKSVIP